MEGEKVLTDDAEVAETMNSFFSNATHDPDISFIDNTILKCRNHPSIIKIKEAMSKGSTFHFTASNEAGILNKINNHNSKKTATFNNIPAKFLVANSDIISPVITKINNNAKSNSDCPDPLKMADITPIHKKDETTLKDNYRPVSILPSISKHFQKDIYEQTSLYFENILSHFLCDFHKGFSAHYYLAAALKSYYG